MAGCGGGPPAPGPVGPGDAPPAPAPLVTPATAEFLLKQPDFTADMVGRFGGQVFTAKMARKGRSFRIETTNPTLVLVVRPQQPTVVLSPEKREYFELPAELPTGPVSSIVAAINTTEGLTVEQVGKDKVEGHDVTRYRLRKPSGDAIVYSADDMQGLVLRIQGLSGKDPFDVIMKNAKLGVTGELLDSKELAAYRRVAPPSKQEPAPPAPNPPE
jgi:hypothetical protein